tara:strand:+ start:3142 stop:4068 length:927 start_codon:yes stop_codon:yes gene_type:complete
MIHVFGSINLDLVFTPPHLPAPGETVLSDRFQAFPGGKGANQAVAAARAGGEVKMIGCVGRDDFATLPLTSFTKAGVDISAVERVEAPTGCATISVAPDGQNQIIVASGANRLVRAEQLRPADLHQGDILMLQMEVDYPEIWKAVDIAARNGLRILLNNAPAGPIPDAVLPKLSLLLVNEIEAIQAAKERNLPADDPLAAATALNRSYGVGLIVTLGADGAVAITGDGGIRVPAPKVEVIDTVGAGDAFCGALAAALADSKALPEALAFASAAGGLACRRHGAQAGLATKSEITELAASLKPVFCDLP